MAKPKSDATKPQDTPEKPQLTFEQKLEAKLARAEAAAKSAADFKAAEVNKPKQESEVATARQALKDALAGVVLKRDDLHGKVGELNKSLRLLGEPPVRVVEAPVEALPVEALETPQDATSRAAGEAEHHSRPVR